MTAEVPLRTLTQVRQAVRRWADRHGVPVATRARLALSAGTVARPWLADGHPLLVRGRRTPAETPDGGRELVVTLVTPGPVRAATTARLPQPARRTGEGAAWHLPLDEAEDPRPSRGEARATEEESLALVEELEAVNQRHRLVNDELAETNSGVLALYVQLEERDEQLRRAHGLVLREIEDALRPAPPEVPGVELAVHYAPAEADAPTGGDLYDWFVLPDGTLHVTVVDALGHGIRSTRSALNVTHSVRTLALEGHGLEHIVERVSTVLNDLDPELMATLLLAHLDPATGELLLANGSHPPALLVRADGDTEYVEVSGRGVGFPAPGSDEVRRVFLERGDLLVLYTDGLTESRRNPIEGEERLAASAHKHLSSPLEEVPAAIAEDMHVEVWHQDDTLALCLRRPEGPVGGAG
ncbi:PP2C family protein-serine/threonine phosphatase [Streptomyces sp. NPDC005438]|uniref:PP2C family protein-serine/threonine phosphatase n=1 Tax=Streptomyces sp. NPDC005438 TaxID=3156880 RepID=UPI0033B8610E